MKKNPKTTDWEEVSKWYDQIVGVEGHYYHRQVIIPQLLKLLSFEAFPSPALLDLACGQGIFSHHIPKNVDYTGVDLSPSLIKAAQQKAVKNHKFFVGDICKSLPVKKKDFTHASIILALQNVAEPGLAIQQASTHLVKGGLFAIVLNHPCFRIPRQSSWGIDEPKKMQYRRVDSYLSAQKIPIQMHPGRSKGADTWTFHHSLSDYSRFLADAGFATLLIEEWTSDKISTGPLAKMENRARKEFPLFLTFLVQKI